MVRKIAVITPVATGHHRECATEAMASAAAFPLHVVVLDGVGRVPEIPPDVNVTMIPHAMVGRSAARNIGIQAANAAGYPWCLFLDADDLLLPTALEDLQAAPEADLYYGESGLDGGGQSYNHLALTDLVRRQLMHVPSRVKLIMANVSIMVRTDRALHLGGFDEDLHQGEHFDFFVRYVLNPKINAHLLKRPIVHIRAGLSSMRFGPWLEDAPERYAKWRDI